MTENISDYIESLVTYFKENSVPYVIVGGLAVNAIGRARMTMDLDLIINHSKLKKQDFVNSMSNRGFDITLSDLDGLDEQSHCTFYPKNSSFRIELKGNYSRLENESIEMAIDFKFDEVEVKIDNPINMIPYKLKFGSEQDYEDALAVYAHNEDNFTDQDLQLRAKSIGVENLIDKFIEEAKEFIREENDSEKQ